MNAEKQLNEKQNVFSVRLKLFNEKQNAVNSGCNELKQK